MPAWTAVVCPRWRTSSGWITSAHPSGGSRAGKRRRRCVVEPEPALDRRPGDPATRRSVGRGRDPRALRPYAIQQPPAHVTKGVESEVVADPAQRQPVTSTACRSSTTTGSSSRTANRPLSQYARSDAGQQRRMLDQARDRSGVRRVPECAPAQQINPVRRASNQAATAASARRCSPTCFLWPRKARQDPACRADLPGLLQSSLAADSRPRSGQRPAQQQRHRRAGPRILGERGGRCTPLDVRPRRPGSAPRRSLRTAGARTGANRSTTDVSSPSTRRWAASAAPQPRGTPAASRWGLVEIPPHHHRDIEGRLHGVDHGGQSRRCASPAEADSWLRRPPASQSGLVCRPRRASGGRGRAHPGTAGHRRAESGVTARASTISSPG
jgi:hypothetical protein